MSLGLSVSLTVLVGLSVLTHAAITSSSQTSPAHRCCSGCHSRPRWGGRHPSVLHWVCHCQDVSDRRVGCKREQNGIRACITDGQVTLDTPAPSTARPDWGPFSVNETNTCHCTSFLTCYIQHSASDPACLELLAMCFNLSCLVDFPFTTTQSFVNRFVSLLINLISNSSCFSKRNWSHFWKPSGVLC